MHGLFYKLPKNTLGCFSGYNLIFHLIAIIITYITVHSGFDWFYFKTFNHTTIFYLLFPAVIIGGLLPIILPLTLLVYGKVKNNFKLTNTAFALGQSAILGILISSFYKAFTGRVQPSPIDTITDISRNFQFGFLRGGVFWGWPSSHTTIAFAMALAFIILYPKNKKIKYFSIFYAFYIGFGISMSIHWFSEFIAGAIIGTAIGVVVGKSFKNRLNTPQPQSENQA